MPRLGGLRRLAGANRADETGTIRDPRCWNCGRIVVRGFVRLPFAAGCHSCDALTVGPVPDGLYVTVASGGFAGRPQRLDEATPEAVARLVVDVVRLHMRLTGATFAVPYTDAVRRQLFDRPLDDDSAAVVMPAEYRPEVNQEVELRWGPGPPSGTVIAVRGSMVDVLRDGRLWTVHEYQLAPKGTRR